MSIANERTWGGWALAALLLLGAAGMVPAVRAQEATAPAAVADRGDLDALRITLEERYRALPARDGVLLVPREELPGIQSLEVSDGEVAINGEVLSPGILRSWLGDEAAPLLRLAALDPETARGLLTVEEPEAAEPGEPADEAPGGEIDDETAQETAAEELADLPGPPAPPVPLDAPDVPRIQLGQQFTLGEDLVIEEDEVALEAVAIGGSVVVLGKVQRDVVAIGGRVEVLGEVGNEIVSVLGGVAIGPEGRVGGNVTAVGGSVQRAPGARIEGELSEFSGPVVGPGDFDWEAWSERRDRPFMRHWRVQEAYWNLVGAAVMALLVCLALLVGRGPVERAARRIHGAGDFVVAGLVGLGVVLLTVPVLVVVVVLLALTIVGCLAIPLIPFALLALAVATIFGYAGVALRIGRWCEARFGWKLAGPYLPALLGVGLIQVWRLVGEGLDVIGGPAALFAAMFFFVGMLVEFVAWMVALGAIVMNLVDRRGARPPGTGYPPGPPPSLPPGGGFPATDPGYPPQPPGPGSHGSAVGGAGAPHSGPPAVPPAGAGVPPSAPPGAPAGASPAAPPVPPGGAGSAPPEAGPPAAPEESAHGSGTDPGRTGADRTGDDRER